MVNPELEAQMHDTVLDVDVLRLASIYAQAALNAAGSLDNQQKLMEEFESVVVDVLDRHPQIEDVFRSELIAEAEKLEIVERIFGGKASEQLLNTLRVMTKHGRLGLVRSVVQSAYQMWEDRSGKVHVELQVPAPLTDDLQREISATLAQVTGADPQITTTINPDLFAGFVARVGDRVYDASARTSLERSRQAMVERCVEAIETRPEQFLEQ